MTGAPPPPGSWRGRPPLSIRFGNPAQAFQTCADFLAPVAPLRHLVLPATLLAGITMMFNGLELQTHLARIALTMTFVQNFLVGLIAANLLAKLVQGVAMAYHGAACDEWGGRLAFALMPKFYIFKGAIRHLAPPAQCACYAAPLLFRLALLGAGMLIWAMLRNTGSGLADLALSIAMVGLSSFLFTANPLFPADGYHWLATRLGRPRLRSQAFQLLWLLITLRPVPSGLPRSEFWLLLLFGTSTIAYTAFLVWSIISSAAFLLEAELQGTGVVIFCILLVVVGLFVRNLLARRQGGAKGRRQPRHS
jgi:hypothetical protein